MGVFARSWQITKLSFEVMKKDKELIFFPLLAGLFSVLFIIVMVFPTIITSYLRSQEINSGPLEIMIMFVTYLGLAFIATFFNVCVVYTTKTRFQGGDATFMDSIKYSLSKAHLILAWSLLAATVGLLLRVVDRLAEKLGSAGRLLVNILTSVLGMVWSLITIFVVPAMVFNDLGPLDAIKKSIEVLKRTWGESLTRYFGLGMIQFLFVMLGLIIIVPLVIITVPIGMAAVFTVIVIGIIYFLTLALIFTLANTIFNTALYVYANTGQIPSGFNQEVMQNAFISKNIPLRNNI